MGGKEISVRSDLFFTFYFLLSTFYFLFSGETVMSLRLTNDDENSRG
ncbi:MAG: hypothetical protein AB1422_02090 [bacterium]